MSLSVRKISCSLPVLRLLFGKESSEGDNVSVDFLLCYRSSLAIRLGHPWITDTPEDCFTCSLLVDVSSYLDE